MSPGIMYTILSALALPVFIISSNMWMRGRALRMDRETRLIRVQLDELVAKVRAIPRLAEHGVYREMTPVPLDTVIISRATVDDLLCLLRDTRNTTQYVLNADIASLGGRAMEMLNRIESEAHVHVQ